jgi:Cu(I)/Ag(I) efflux system membrane fusion protein
LDVNTTGEVVRAGQPLAHIFSQELLSSQTEYLSARRHTSASGISSAVTASGRTRLGVLGMSTAEIDAIEQTGEPKRLVTVVAPRTGVVVNRGVTVGTSVDPSTTLLTIADLSRVWVLAEVPEASIPGVRVGTVAQLDFPASGRSPFTARVDFVYPTLTERTRTLRVRLSAGNPSGTLRPGLYGTAVFEAAGQNVITVPRDAVVDTGVQQHVFVAVGDMFEPRSVTIGAQLADRVEIREGLREGEQIVAAGVFLLDSESRLRATGGAGGHQHGTPAGGQQPPSASKTDPHAGHEESSATPAVPRPADPRAGHRPASANASADRE